MITLPRDDETVFVTVNGQLSTSKSRYHTDEDCYLLQTADEYRETTEDMIVHREQCHICSGEWSPRHEREETFECEYCGREFVTSNGHSRHVLTEHSDAVDSLLNDEPEAGEPIPDGGRLVGPSTCPNCGYDPTGDDEFTSGGGWQFSNSVSDGIWLEELHCPRCNEVVARNETSTWGDRR